MSLVAVAPIGPDQAVEVRIATVRGASLPPTLSTEEAAPWFGTTADTLRELARRGEAPLQPLQLGRHLRWPTALVLASVGIEAVAIPHNEESGRP